jgi:hypothetical protein
MIGGELLAVELIYWDVNEGVAMFPKLPCEAKI